MNLFKCETSFKYMFTGDAQTTSASPTSTHSQIIQITIPVIEEASAIHKSKFHSVLRNLIKCWDEFD